MTGGYAKQVEHNAFHIRREQQVEDRQIILSAEVTMIDSS